jgi:hypothetical protein
LPLGRLGRKGRVAGASWTGMECEKAERNWTNLGIGKGPW